MEFYLDLITVTEKWVTFASGKNVTPDSQLTFQREKWEKAGTPLQIYVSAEKR